ncbi:MAG TPA: ATP-binding protein [Bryobacteraceae bacterium]|nr:ATP-binding protein [Bryobacteraceae bacterium]
MRARLAHFSLLWKILLSTSIAVTVLFAITGWIVQDNAIRATSLSLQDEVRASFHAYDSLWRSRAEMLASVSLVLSRMSDVRAAFGTGDEATIRDTAKELWDKISRDDAIFLVTDPRGRVIASLGGRLNNALKQDLPVVRAAASSFPRQASGFLMSGGHLYQIAVTPVYVQASNGLGLLDVLVAGYTVDEAVAQHLHALTGGSEFVFISGGSVVASTLPASADRTIQTAKAPPEGLAWIDVAGAQYTMLGTPLLDIRGRAIGDLYILRSFEAARQHIAILRRNIVLIWLFAVLLGMGATYGLARRILEPVRELDRGAAEVAEGNFDYRVPVNSDDELGRLAQAFNAMSASIRDGRQELIRRERISTIGRLSTSIVHDLRNPLAAIYGGAEMLVDGDLSPEQVQRLAGNIYRSSRRVQELLQELVDIGRGKSRSPELCRLSDIVTAAYDVYASAAESQSVAVRIDIPDTIELPLERARIERVFLNLIDNALAVMPNGGSLDFSANTAEAAVVVTVQDTGPGIAPEIRRRLFQPFVTAGKKNGIGLGLALSHQAVLDHGGELWADSDSVAGARFFVKLPL